MSLSNIQWSPVEYEKAAYLAQEVGQVMLSRLELMTINPSVILDAGCGAGYFCEHLKSRYPNAEVVALDSTREMVNFAKQRTTLILCGDMVNAPLRSQSVDLIFANLLSPWIADIKGLMAEFSRLLRPNGILMLSAFGPDTLKELPSICAPFCIDVHDLGDLLVGVNLEEPVLEVTDYTVRYKDKKRLFQELLASGMIEVEKEVEIQADSEGKWPITYEIIYAHAFAAVVNTESLARNGEVRIALSDLRKSLKDNSGSKE